MTGVELVGGVEKRSLVLVDPDPSWPEVFSQHADRTRAALGLRAQEVEHIGSTSVPGLAAKPIVDILVTVDDITDLLPSMEWKVSDALPERTLSYNDSGPAWVSADKNSTLNPRQPATFPVLYADEYGFHAQNILWRGHFSVGDLASAPTGVFLNVIGGTSHGWSAYLNGAFLGSIFGNVSLSDTNRTLAFDGAELKEGDNVLFVIQDNMGHDQTTGALNPRGILNATLLGGNEGETAFSSWKVAGKAGGQDNIDPIRGAYNEGGLTAERLGWHLPGFDDGDWQAGSPNEGFAEAGAKFYRSVFPLDVPRGYDVSLAFELAPGVERSALRAQMYVNGYSYGEQPCPTMMEGRKGPTFHH